MFICIHLCRERIPRHVRTFQHQREKLLRIAFHAFIAYPYKSRARSVLIVIIRCQNTSLYFDFKQRASFVFNRDKLYFRYRVKPCLYHFADKVGIRLYVLQSYNFAFIVYAIEQAATIRIGESRHGLEPRLHFLAFQHLLEIVKRTFCYKPVIVYLHDFLVVIRVQCPMSFTKIQKKVLFPFRRDE